MPKFKLPELKKEEEGEDKAGAISQYSPLEDPWARRIRIPANKAIMDVLKLGVDVKVTLKGKIQELRSEERMDVDSFSEFVLELSEVEAYAGNAFSDLDESMDDE